MRNEYKAKPLTQEEINKIWDAIYNANPDVKRALKDVRADSQEAQSLVTGLFKGFFNSDLAQEVAETTSEKDRLYKYWKEAGLEGTPAQFFSKFLRENPQILSNLRDGQSGFETYDYSKPPMSKKNAAGEVEVEGNTRVARNNMLIHLIQERLMDEETFDERYTPGGFANASNAARVMRELLYGDLDGIVDATGIDFDAIDKRIARDDPDPEPNYDPSDPMTLITYNQQNQVAGKLIGIFANQNTNHAFSSLMDKFTINENYAFRFCGKGYRDFLHAPEGVDVDLNVAEFLAASVDAVKDPVLNFLNLNTITADSGAILARLGYTTRDIGLLFNQPVIKRVCDYAFNNNVGVDEAIRQIASNLKKNPNEQIPEASPDVAFSANQLAKNIVKDRLMTRDNADIMSLEEYRINQLQVLNLFSQIRKVASDVSQFVTSTKFTASNAVGATFGDMYAQQMRVSKYISRFGKEKSNGKEDMSISMSVTDRLNIPMSDRLDTLEMDDISYMETLLENPFAYEQAMFDMNRKAIRLLCKYFPYDKPVYATMRRTLASLTRSGTLDADTINSAHSELLVYMLVEQGGLFNGDYPCKNGIPAKDYYRNHFTQEVINILDAEPELSELPIFKYLNFQVEEIDNPVTRLKEEKYSMNIQDIGGLQPYQKEEIKDSWAELYKTHPNLARDLFMYNFYKLGFTFSPLSFMNLAPVELKQSIIVGDSGKNYVDFLKEILDGQVSINQDNFARQYILNHLDNKRLVYTPRGKFYKKVKSLAKPEGTQIFASRFDLDISSPEDNSEDYSIWTLPSEGLEEGELAFRPCIMIDGVVYMAQSDSPKGFNIGANGKMTYVKVEPLGSKNKSLQYNSSSTTPVSTVDPNDIQTPSGSENGPQDDGGNDPDIPGGTFDRAALENEIIEEMTKARIKKGTLMQEDAQNYKDNFLEQFKQFEDQDILDTVEYIRNSKRENGIIVLDENGNPVPAC